MKKVLKNKLALGREVVRRLSAAQLANVPGGMPASRAPQVCKNSDDYDFCNTSEDV